VIVELESTLKRNVSPAVIVVVQAVRVVEWPLFAVRIAGFAAAVIVSATVGG
jgi:hypothetical protein